PSGEFLIRSRRSMKIAYVLIWRITVNNGVVWKVKQQVDCWRRLGHEVTVFCASDEEDVSDSVLEVHHIKRPDSRNVVMRFFQNWLAYRELGKAVDDYSPDLVYTRLAFYHPCLKALMRRHCSCFEVNSFSSAELRMKRKNSLYFRFLDLYNHLTKDRFLKGGNGIVTVTDELADLECAGIKAELLTLPNSVDLKAFRQLPALSPADPDRPPRLVFIGGPMPVENFYHGVDKIFDLARATAGRLEFDLIGQDTYPFGQVPSNVTVHGYLDRDRYEDVFARADVGVGTLALHRKDMEEACPLKVREYLAYGLPVILGYEDTALKKLDEPWILTLPNTEENLVEAAEEVVRFARAMQGQRVPRPAVEHLIGYESLERDRLAFFQGLVDRGAVGVQELSQDQVRDAV
ncbi:MAG: glycosyltransferase family 4 protein, partial [Verrucomicrobiota bacterium]